MRHRQRQGLVIIVRQHQGGDVIGHGGQHGIALGGIHFAPAIGAGEQYLQIDFVIRRINASGIVYRIGVNAPATFGIFDTAKLRHAQIGAFAHHQRLDLVAVHPHRVIGAVADIQIALALRFDIGADAAEPKKISLGFEQRIDQRRR